MGVKTDLKLYNLRISDLSKDFFARIDYDYFRNMELFRESTKSIKFKKLKEIITFIETGKPIEQKDYADSETGYIHLAPRDIKGNEIEIREPIYLTGEKGEELSEYKLNQGNILLVISSNVGDTVIFNLNNNIQYTISHYIIRLEINKEEYSPSFLVNYLNHPITKLFFRATETGKTQQNLSKAYIFNLPIPDISKDKQEEIMKELNPKIKRKKELKNEIIKLDEDSNSILWKNLK